MLQITYSTVREAGGRHTTNCSALHNRWNSWLSFVSIITSSLPPAVFVLSPDSAVVVAVFDDGGGPTHNSSCLRNPATWCRICWKMDKPQHSRSRVSRLLSWTISPCWQKEYMPIKIEIASVLDLFTGRNYV